MRTYYWTLAYDTATLPGGTLVTWYAKRKTLPEIRNEGIWYTESKKECQDECVKRNRATVLKPRL